MLKESGIFIRLEQFWIGLLLLGLLLPTAGGAAEVKEDQVRTFWPLFDYRSSPVHNYSSLHLLGPLFKLESKGTETEFSLRPLLFHAWETDGEDTVTEVLYPIGGGKSRRGLTSFHVLHLLNYEFGDAEEGSDNEFMLFPFLFYGDHEERGPFFAFFPFGGTLYEKFGRDEIRFTLFPLYGRTLKGSTTTTNILYPFFASIQGEDESGFKVWPLYGQSEKTGVYRKRFALWPIFYSQDLALDTDNPKRRRGVFPLYTSEISPQRTSRTVLWPFFSHIEDQRRDYEEWNAPWPLVRVTSGRYKEGVKVLPLFADERVGDGRSRWFLWPLYKIEEIDSDYLYRRRDRVLFFLYSDLLEQVKEDEVLPKRRRALWPVFQYESSKGVHHFSTLALLEPFFPDNGGILRNWAPLWRIYQTRWDNHGNSISSLLWNLYWKERRGDDLAWELFPLVNYRRENQQLVEMSLLKGLVSFRSQESGRRLHLFYLPWGVPLGGEVITGEGSQP
ncbi:MAG: hypothetical protein ACYDAI_02100 [Trichloromonadaceae bacterium]